MLVVVEKSEVLKALDHTRHSVRNKSALPVLENVLVEVKGDMLTFTTADLETFVISKVQLDTRQTDGAVTVPHAKMLKVVWALPEGPVVLSADDTSLQVTSGTSKFDLDGINANEFPFVTMPIVDLLDKLGKVVPMAATDDSRPILRGVHFSNMLATTNGFQLGIVPLGEAMATDGVVNLDMVKTVMKILKKIKTGTVSFSMDQEDGSMNAAFFVTPEILIGGYLIEGTFPDYMQIVPRADQLDAEVLVSVDEFSTVLKQANVLADTGQGGSLGVRLEANELLILRVKDAEVGTFSGSVERLDKEPVIVEGEKVINGGYILNLLKSPAFGKGDVVKLEWEGGKQGPFVVSNDSSGDGALYVIMPMHIGKVREIQKVKKGEK